MSEREIEWMEVESGGGGRDDGLREEEEEDMEKKRNGGKEGGRHGLTGIWPWRSNVTGILHAHDAITYRKSQDQDPVTLHLSSINFRYLQITDKTHHTVMQSIF